MLVSYVCMLHIMYVCMYVCMYVYLCMDVICMCACMMRICKCIIALVYAYMCQTRIPIHAHKQQSPYFTDSVKIS